MFADNGTIIGNTIAVVGLISQIVTIIGSVVTLRQQLPHRPGQPNLEVRPDPVLPAPALHWYQLGIFGAIAALAASAGLIIINLLAFTPILNDDESALGVDSALALVLIVVAIVALLTAASAAGGGSHRGRVFALGGVALALLISVILLAPEVFDQNPTTQIMRFDRIAYWGILLAQIITLALFANRTWSAGTAVAAGYRRWLRLRCVLLAGTVGLLTLAAGPVGNYVLVHMHDPLTTASWNAWIQGSEATLGVLVLVALVTLALLVTVATSISAWPSVPRILLAGNVLGLSCAAIYLGTRQPWWSMDTSLPLYSLSGVLVALVAMGFVLAAELAWTTAPQLSAPDEAKMQP